jgi:hypothetical protein
MELNRFLQLVRGDHPGGRLVVMAVAPPERPSGVLVRKLMRALGEFGDQPALLFADRGPWFGDAWFGLRAGQRHAFAFRRAAKLEAIEEQAERLRRAGRMVVIASRASEVDLLDSLRRRADLIVWLTTPATPETQAVRRNSPADLNAQLRAA